MYTVCTICIMDTLYTVCIQMWKDVRNVYECSKMRFSRDSQEGPNVWALSKHSL